LTLGHAWGEGRKTLATLTAIAMLCGELFALAQTGDRIAAERERRQAPAQRQIEAHEKAAAQVEKAQRTLKDVPATSDRLEAAIRNKAEADRAVLEKSAEKNCATNCRALLEQQVDLAQQEIEAARKELDTMRQQAGQELAAARAKLDGAPLPQMSGTPLADRLNVDAATLDIIVASLGSLGANGLAACLLAFAAHGRHAPRPTPQQQPRTAPAAEATRSRSSRRKGSAKATAKDEADIFAGATFRPDEEGCVTLAEIKAAYHDWCAPRPPLPDDEIGAALSELFASVGLYPEGRGADAAIHGISWRTRPDQPQQVEPERRPLLRLIGGDKARRTSATA
jgi:hypothetical protein